MWDAAVGSAMDRRTTFVALGGGVIGDMTGFAAAAYQRGVHFLQVCICLCLFLGWHGCKRCASPMSMPEHACFSQCLVLPEQLNLLSARRRRQRTQVISRS